MCTVANGGEKLSGVALSLMGGGDGNAEGDTALIGRHEQGECADGCAVVLYNQEALDFLFGQEDILAVSVNHSPKMLLGAALPSLIARAHRIVAQSLDKDKIGIRKGADAESVGYCHKHITWFR